MEEITDADYAHAKKVCKDFEIKFMLADVFENFRSMCLEIYELGPAKIFSAPGLAVQVALKQAKVNLHLLPDIGMLLMVEKRIRGRMCPSIY